MKKDKRLIGIDVGGTKCAITLGMETAADINIMDRLQFATTSCQETIDNLLKSIYTVLERNGLKAGDIAAMGISCGGPLDSHIGVVMSPPNLPGWNNIPICDIITKKFGVPCALQNDANACALAEWCYGAGKGTNNMAFLTFGTGLGAGLVLDGKLYTGTNDNAGELGHIRLSDFGPVGYGKEGSFEGFCSGGGIAQLARNKVKEAMQMGQKVNWCPEGNPDKITAKIVAEAMNEGDALARSIYEISAKYLGRGLSILIDIINPEVIVIGSIYARNEEMMKPLMQAVIDFEALPLASKVCRVVPAALGESIGDYAAISVASTLKVD